MKRWTSNRAALVLGAALIAAPAAAAAQTPAASPSQEMRQAAPAAGETQTDPRQHLAAAEAALGRISSTAVTGDAQARIGELRSHVAKLRDGLDKTAADSGGASWSSEVADIDRIIAALLSESPTTGTGGTTEPQPTGTSGVTTNKAEEAVALDSETRARLTEVRDAVTAFATAMNRSDASAPAATPTPSNDAAATPAESATTQADPSTPADPAATPTPAAPTPATPTPATPAPAAQATPSDAQPDDAATDDTAASKRALTAARDSLADLTKLPAASQLAGEARAQVQQLIANFNDLITASSNWRAAYAKVDASLTTLIGAETADESPSTPVAGNAGAVGTSGKATGSLDPTIEAKLVEFRTHLKDFERAAGGGTPAAAATAPEATATPAASPETAAATEPAGTPAPASGPMDTATARSHIEAIEGILNAAGATTLTATQVDELKTHVAELKKLLGDR